MTTTRKCSVVKANHNRLSERTRAAIDRYAEIDGEYRRLSAEREQLRKQLLKTLKVGPYRGDHRAICISHYARSQFDKKALERDLGTAIIDHYTTFTEVSRINVVHE